MTLCLVLVGVGGRDPRQDLCISVLYSCSVYVLLLFLTLTCYFFCLVFGVYDLRGFCEQVNNSVVFIALVYVVNCVPCVYKCIV